MFFSALSEARFLFSYVGFRLEQLVMYIRSKPSVWVGCNAKSIFQQNLTRLNWEFSFSQTYWHTKVKEPSLLYYLPIAEGRIFGFMPFLRILMVYEMQLASSMIWTHFTMSISYDDNHYTTFSLLCMFVIPIVIERHLWRNGKCCRK